MEALEEAQEEIEQRTADQARLEALVASLQKVRIHNLEISYCIFTFVLAPDPAEFRYVSGKRCSTRGE